MESMIYLLEIAHYFLSLTFEVSICDKTMKYIAVVLPLNFIETARSKLFCWDAWTSKEIKHKNGILIQNSKVLRMMKTPSKLYK